MQQRNPLLRAQPGQRRFELQRLVDCLLHERFNGLLTPRAERASTKPSSKTLYPGETDAVNLSRFTVEDRDAAIDEDLPNFVRLTALIVVVAEHGDDGNLHDRKLTRENPRLIRQPVVCKV